MKTWKCIIADDEPLARELISDYVAKVPFLDLKGIFTNAWEVRDFLQENSVDLLLIDIEMPGLDGLTFIKSYPIQPQVIFITAHRKYAVEAFEVRAFDYLLKFISINRQQYNVSLDGLLYIESKGDYLKFILEDHKPLITKMTLNPFNCPKILSKFIGLLLSIKIKYRLFKRKK